jgi:hypothetical protein
MNELRSVASPRCGTHRPGKSPSVDAVAAVVLGLILLLPVIFVGCLFVWGARKDGEEDKSLQARLGIRRRTRLGR